MPTIESCPGNTNKLINKHNISNIKLTPQANIQLIETSKDILQSYLLLEILNNKDYATREKSMMIDDQKISFLDFIKTHIDDGSDISNGLNIKLGTQDCTIKITKSNDAQKYDIEITEDNPNINNPNLGDIKKINEYEGRDFLDLCIGRKLTLSKNNKNEFVFGTNLKNNPDIQIGGSKKIGLYNIHISNMFEMINHLQNSDNPNMLIAMATGSGKSFTQALLFMALKLNNMSCAFTAPNNQLAGQLLEDFKRILPDSITKDLNVNLDKEKMSKYQITTHKHLLDVQLKELMDNNNETNPIFLTFDESHQLDTTELYKKRLELLSKQYPIVLLSATPSEDSFKLCGGKALSTLSTADKKKLGLMNSAISLALSPKTIIAKSKERLSKKEYSKVKFWKRVSAKFTQFFNDQNHSAAFEFIETLGVTINEKDKNDKSYKKLEDNIRDAVRWNMTTPNGKKFLAITNNPDEIINMNEALSDKFYIDLRECADQEIYQSPTKANKRKSKTNVLYNVFKKLFPDGGLNKRYENKYSEITEKFKFNHYNRYIKNNFPNSSIDERKQFIDENVDFANSNQYMQYAVLHNLINHTLNFLTGYDSIELSKRRFENLDGLIKEIDAKILGLDHDAAKKKIAGDLKVRGLPKKLANEIAIHIGTILTKLSEKDINRSIIDNWSNDKKLHNSEIWTSELNEFCEKQRKVFIANSNYFDKSGVNNNRPFFNLKETRKLNLGFISEISSRGEYDFTPEYCEYDEAQANILAKLGFIGVYVNSNNGTGWSDLNLHNIVSIVNSTDDVMNSPSNRIQIEGRLRCKDDREQSYNFVVASQNAKISLLPGVDNSIAALSKATIEYNKILNKNLSRKIATIMSNFIDDNKKALLSDNSTESSAANDKIDQKLQDLLITECHDLFNRSDHDYKKMSKEFDKVLNDVKKHMFEYLNNDVVADKVDIILLIKIHQIIGRIAGFISRCIFFFITFNTNRRFKKEVIALNLDQNPDLENEKTYAHIINTYDSHKILQYRVPALILLGNFRDGIDEVIKEAKDLGAKFEKMGKDITEIIKSEQAEIKENINAIEKATNIMIEEMQKIFATKIGSVSFLKQIRNNILENQKKGKTSSINQLLLDEIKLIPSIKNIIQEIEKIPGAKKILDNMESSDEIKEILNIIIGVENFEDLNNLLNYAINNNALKTTLFVSTKEATQYLKNIGNKTIKAFKNTFIRSDQSQLKDTRSDSGNSLDSGNGSDSDSDISEISSYSRKSSSLKRNNSTTSSKSSTSNKSSDSAISNASNKSYDSAFTSESLQEKFPRIHSDILYNIQDEQNKILIANCTKRFIAEQFQDPEVMHPILDKLKPIKKLLEAQYKELFACELNYEEYNKFIMEDNIEVKKEKGFISEKYFKDLIPKLVNIVDEKKSELLDNQSSIASSPLIDFVSLEEFNLEQLIKEYSSTDKIATEIHSMQRFMLFKLKDRIEIPLNKFIQKEGKEIFGHKVYKDFMTHTLRPIETDHLKVLIKNGLKFINKQKNNYLKDPVTGENKLQNGISKAIKSNPLAESLTIPLLEAFDLEGLDIGKLVTDYYFDKEDPCAQIALELKEMEKDLSSMKFDYYFKKYSKDPIKFLLLNAIIVGVEAVIDNSCNYYKGFQVISPGDNTSILKDLSVNSDHAIWNIKTPTKDFTTLRTISLAHAGITGLNVAMDCERDLLKWKKIPADKILSSIEDLRKGLQSKDSCSDLSEFTDLGIQIKNLKPLTEEDIRSPNTKFSDAMVQKFSILQRGEAIRG